MFSAVRGALANSGSVCTRRRHVAWLRCVVPLGITGSISVPVSGNGSEVLDWVEEACDAGGYTGVRGDGDVRDGNVFVHRYCVIVIIVVVFEPCSHCVCWW
jgi:hypothetical protein